MYVLYRTIRHIRHSIFATLFYLSHQRAPPERKRERRPDLKPADEQLMHFSRVMNGKALLARAKEPEIIDAEEDEYKE